MYELNSFLYFSFSNFRLLQSHSGFLVILFIEYLNTYSPSSIPSIPDAKIRKNRKFHKIKKDFIFTVMHH